MIAFVGRHEERKGLGVLLEAFSRLRQQTPALPIVLEVVGDGPDTAELRRKYGADDRIEWLGAVSDTERAQVLANADVFVAPSLHGESFGVVIIEAMAAGAPVVASSLDGYKLAAGDAARFFAPGDVTGLSDVLRELVADPGELERLRLLGHARAAAYSLDSIAATYLEIYESLLAGERAS